MSEGPTVKQIVYVIYCKMIRKMIAKNTEGSKGGGGGGRGGVMILFYTQLLTKFRCHVYLKQQIT